LFAIVNGSLVLEYLDGNGRWGEIKIIQEKKDQKSKKKKREITKKALLGRKKYKSTKKRFYGAYGWVMWEFMNATRSEVEN
jgi:hypothetical protein